MVDIIMTTSFIARGGPVMVKPTVKKSVRLIDMMWLLRDAWVTTVDLALLYGVTVRTIRRDLRDLQSEPIRAAVVDDDGQPLRYHIVRSKCPLGKEGENG